MNAIPQILSNISCPPKNIFIKGAPLENDFKGIAIVGTRKASSEGIVIAELFAKTIALSSIPVISGLAFGIDSAAHKAALSVSKRTVAVLAGGVEKIYPASNASLANKIIESNGSIISEFKDEPSYPDLFLRRNRIISGLSIAIIVIEAPLKSGAISTASWAVEQGKEVFVVPGPITNPNYKGSHKLIRDGARLVTSPEEVLSDLNIKNLAPNDLSKENISSDALIIFEIIIHSHKAISIDKIISNTKLEPQRVLSALTELEIAKKIIETPTGYSPNVK